MLVCVCVRLGIRGGHILYPDIMSAQRSEYRTVLTLWGHLTGPQEQLKGINQLQLELDLCVSIVLISCFNNYFNGR